MPNEQTLTKTNLILSRFDFNTSDLSKIGERVSMDLHLIGAAFMKEQMVASLQIIGEEGQ